MFDMDKSNIIVFDSLRKPQDEYKELIDMLNKSVIALLFKYLSIQS
jgi:hypothetical protein